MRSERSGSDVSQVESEREEMRSRSKSQPDPRPVIPQGETEFEEKRIECEFELVFKRIADMGLSSIKETHEYAFRAGVVTGKNMRNLNEGKQS